MGMTVIDLDIKNLPLEDFMKALGHEPTKREGNLLTYKAPYSLYHNTYIIVDTGNNRWYDINKPENRCGGIYDLAGELTHSANPYELNLYIATQMKGFKDFKTYRATSDGREILCDMTVVMPVSKQDAPIETEKIEQTKPNGKIDINDLPISDYMKAIGFEPLKRMGKLLLYDCPYAASEPIRTVVDTEKNHWYDTEDFSYYGDIYRLAAEITCKESRSELTQHISTKMKNLEQYKSCEFTDRHERPGAKVLVIGFTISDPGMPKQPPKEQPRPELPKVQQSKPKRKMRF